MLRGCALSQCREMDSAGVRVRVCVDGQGKSMCVCACVRVLPRRCCVVCAELCRCVMRLCT